MPLKTAMQDTSLEAYRSIQPRLHPMQQRILTFLRAHQHRDWTNKQLAYALGRPINTVTPRVLELRAKGLVVFSKTIVQGNGRKAMAWRART